MADPTPSRLTSPNQPMIYHHHHVSHTKSTNTELLDAVTAGLLDACSVHVLTCDMQTKGRGQYGRSWQSPVGNVYLSLYHPLKRPLSGLLSLLVAYHLVNSPFITWLNARLTQAGIPKLGVKWANDIGYYAHDSRQSTQLVFHKLAGILIEPVYHAGKLVGAVIGVGINVCTSPDLSSKTQEGIAYHPIGLQSLSDRIGLCTRYRVHEFYDPLTTILCQSVQHFEYMMSHESMRHRFTKQFEAVNVLLHRLVTFDDDTDPHQVVGIHTDGGLIVQRADGTYGVKYTGSVRAVSCCDL